MKILLVDDDYNLLEQLSQELMKGKYLVDTAADGEAAIDRISANPYDLIILDIMLPRQDGLTVLRKIREYSINTPVLLLTARNSVTDKIEGLDTGADDYLTKPFSMAELLARIRSLLRRSGDEKSTLLSVGDVSLNTITRAVLKKNKEIQLTAKEFAILEFLLYNKNRVVSRFSLVEHVWGEAYDPFSMSNFIDVHVKNLRQKLFNDDATCNLRTIRGVGFTIEENTA
jgi:DNA-binding response OmpR family regulator